MPAFDDAAIGVIGASLAGLHAVAELRRAGYAGRVVVIGAEEHAPYDRPPLSKDVLLGTVSAADVALPLDPATDVEWRLGVPAIELDVDALAVTLADGRVERFLDGIVIATGAAARRLPGAELSGVHVVRTLEDSLGLAAALARRPARVFVVGAGFIGCEVASVARALDLPVLVIEPEEVPLARALSAEVGRQVEALHRTRGVEFQFGMGVDRFEADARGHIAALHLTDGRRLAADCVVLSVGARPATAWLAGSGLLTGGELRADEAGVVAPGVVAAGDVVSRPSARQGGFVRSEHWDNAVRQGRHVADVLLDRVSGDDRRYDPVPWVWSDQHGRKLQMLGSGTGADEVAVVLDDPTRDRFVALYRRDTRLIGAFAINAARPIVQCRRLLETDATWDAAIQSFAVSA